MNLQQLALSNSIARSLKLDVLESLMDSALARMRQLPANLKSGKLPSEKLCRELVGEQLEIRAHINLYSVLSLTHSSYTDPPH